MIHFRLLLLPNLAWFIQRFCKGFYYLKETWRDSLSFVDSRRFLAPWRQKKLTIGVDDTTLIEIENGIYDGFDSLPANLQPDSIKIGNHSFIYLFFDNYIHPVLLSPFFEVLPGIISAEPDPIGFMGGCCFPMKFGKIEGEFAFIFQASSIIFSPHLFKYVDGVPLYHGLINYDSDSLLIEDMQNINQQWFDKSGWQ